MKRCSDCRWISKTEYGPWCSNFNAVPDKYRLNVLAEDRNVSAMLCRDESLGGKCGLEARLWEPKLKPIWQRLREWLRGRAET